MNTDTTLGERIAKKAEEEAEKQVNDNVMRKVQEEVDRAIGTTKAQSATVEQVFGQAPPESLVMADHKRMASTKAGAQASIATGSQAQVLSTKVVELQDLAAKAELREAELQAAHAKLQEVATKI